MAEAPILFNKFLIAPGTDHPGHLTAPFTLPPDTPPIPVEIDLFNTVTINDRKAVIEAYPKISALPIPEELIAGALQEGLMQYPVQKINLQNQTLTDLVELEQRIKSRKGAIALGYWKEEYHDQAGLHPRQLRLIVINGQGDLPDNSTFLKAA